MDMFIRTNRYFDKEKYELNKSELIFIRISIHTILFLNVYIHSGISTRIEKVQNLPSKHEVFVLFAEDRNI